MNEQFYLSLVNRKDYTLTVRYNNLNKNEITTRRVHVLGVDENKSTGNITVLCWDIEKNDYRRFHMNQLEVLRLEQESPQITPITLRKLFLTPWKNLLKNVSNILTRFVGTEK